MSSIPRGLPRSTIQPLHPYTKISTLILPGCAHTPTDSGNLGFAIGSHMFRARVTAWTPVNISSEQTFLKPFRSLEKKIPSGESLCRAQKYSNGRAVFQRKNKACCVLCTGTRRTHSTQTRIFRAVNPEITLGGREPTHLQVLIRYSTRCTARNLTLEASQK